MADTSDALKAQRAALRAASRVLHGSPPEPPHRELERVAAWCAEHEIEADSYGEGTGLQAFEARVGDLLGYPASRFMPSGTMAQQIAIRLWSESTGSSSVGMHPTCHLELHERRGYQRLHGLHAVLLGDRGAPLRPQDLVDSTETIGTLVVELPTRENGGQLASWDELVELSATARQAGIALHLDGARLWEAAAGYDRPLDDICELFDSTYVSFYKGIGALPGSMLLGPQDFIDEAIVWQARHGGSLYTQMANWVSANMRLDTQLAKMASYRDAATAIAAAMANVDGLTINPEVPHVNMFHVFLEGDADGLLAARDSIAEDHGLWLFGGLQATDVPRVHKFEVAIGDAALDLHADEIADGFRVLLGAAASG